MHSMDWPPACPGTTRAIRHLPHPWAALQATGRAAGTRPGPLYCREVLSNLAILAALELEAASGAERDEWAP